MTILMAGVDCRELFTLMTAFFGQGTNFADDPFAFLDGAPIHPTTPRFNGYGLR